MEYRVDAEGDVREPKGEQVGTRLREDCVRPEELSQLLRWCVSCGRTVPDIGSDPTGRPGLGTAGISRPWYRVVLQQCFHPRWLGGAHLESGPNSMPGRMRGPAQGLKGEVRVIALLAKNGVTPVVARGVL